MKIRLLEAKKKDVKIEVENPGLLEVPEGKKVYDLPVSHFKKLIDKKGREKIIRGITNLETWNKNDDPKIASWAKKMKKSLEGYGEKKESLKESKEDDYGFLMAYVETASGAEAKLIVGVADSVLLNRLATIVLGRIGRDNYRLMKDLVQGKLHHYSFERRLTTQVLITFQEYQEKDTDDLVNTTKSKFITLSELEEMLTPGYTESLKESRKKTDERTLDRAFASAYHSLENGATDSQEIISGLKMIYNLSYDEALNVFREANNEFMSDKENRWEVDSSRDDWDEENESLKEDYSAVTYRNLIDRWGGINSPTHRDIIDEIRAEQRRKGAFIDDVPDRNFTRSIMRKLGPLPNIREDINDLIKQIQWSKSEVLESETAEILEELKADLVKALDALRGNRI